MNTPSDMPTTLDDVIRGEATKQGEKRVVKATLQETQKPVVKTAPEARKVVTDELKRPKKQSRPSQTRMRIGKVISTSGIQVLVIVDIEGAAEKDMLPRIGSLVCIETSDAVIISLVSGMSSPAMEADADMKQVMILELELIGQISMAATGESEFRRGVVSHPVLGDVAALPSQIDLELIFATRNSSMMRLGKLSERDTILAMASPDQLLQGNMAVLGMSGSGKSCGMIRIVRSLIRKQNPVRSVLFDIHNEYSSSFGRVATQMNMSAGILPHWVLDFTELQYLLSLEGGVLTSLEVNLLKEAIPLAKKRHMKFVTGESISASLDTPVPYKVSDLINYIDQIAAKTSQEASEEYQQLRAKLISMNVDPRYSLIFGKITAQDTLAELLQTLFNLDGKGRPICIVNCADIASELCELVVSAITRLSHAVAKWSNGAVPILLCVEEAHRFLPAQASLKTHTPNLAETALTNVIENGRKIGVNACLISARPRSLSPSLLEQCSTIFAMRMTNKADQDEIMQIVPEVAFGLMSALGTLGRGEALAIGEGLPLPMRLRFDPLPEAAVPVDATTANRTSMNDGEDQQLYGDTFVADIVNLWRSEGHTREHFVEEAVPTPPRLAAIV